MSKEKNDNNETWGSFLQSNHEEEHKKVMKEINTKIERCVKKGTAFKKSLYGKYFKNTISVKDAEMLKRILNNGR